MDPRDLRQKTRAEHEATEALMPLMGEGLTPELYGRVLLVVETVVGSWESWASRNAPPGLARLVADRKRSGLLQADLRCLGISGRGSGDAGPDWDEVVGAARGEASGPVFEAAFLGAMYVMEGSTLGGRFIATHVEKVLGLAPGQGNAYFRGHEEATGAMWREVTREIEKVPDALASVVIEAAKRAFGAFGDALQAGLAASEAVHG